MCMGCLFNVNFIDINVIFVHISSKNMAWYERMFGFIKKIFIGLLSICTTTRLRESLNSNSERRVKYVSLNKRPCEAGPTLVDTNSYETLFYRFTVSVNK